MVDELVPVEEVYLNDRGFRHQVEDVRPRPAQAHDGDLAQFQLARDALDAGAAGGSVGVPEDGLLLRALDHWEGFSGD